MKLMSGGDGVILRCEEVEISALSATFGVVFSPYHVQMSSDGPVLCRIGKPLPKPIRKGASTFSSPTLVPSESSFETIYAPYQQIFTIKILAPTYSRHHNAHDARVFPKKKFMSLYSCLQGLILS